MPRRTVRLLSLPERAQCRAVAERIGVEPIRLQGEGAEAGFQPPAARAPHALGVAELATGAHLFMPAPELGLPVEAGFTVQNDEPPPPAVADGRVDCALVVEEEELFPVPGVGLQIPEVGGLVSERHRLDDVGAAAELLDERIEGKEFEE